MAEMRGQLQQQQSDIAEFKKSVVEGNVEVKLRAEPQSEKVPIDQAPQKVIGLINRLKEIDARVIKPYII